MIIQLWGQFILKPHLYLLLSSLSRYLPSLMDSNENDFDQMSTSINRLSLNF